MPETRQINKTVLKGCILYESLRKIPVFNAFKNTCKLMKNDPIDYIDFEYWFHQSQNADLDLSFHKSSDPKSLTFSKLPLEIIDKIVNKLNLKNRLKIRKVSRNFRYIIDRPHKVNIDSIEIITGNQFCFMIFGEHCVNYFEKDDGCMVVDSVNETAIDNEDYVEIAMNDVAAVLKNPKIEMNRLKIMFTAPELSEKCLKFMEWKSEIHVKSVEIDTKNIEEVSKILSYLKPGTLEEIKLISVTGNGNANLLTKFLEMEQWKQLKEVQLLSTENLVIPIEQFFHLRYFDTYLAELSVEDIIRIRDVLSKSVNFENCQLRSTFFFENIVEITEALGDIHTDIFLGISFFYHRYQIPGTDKFLHFEMTNMDIFIEKI